MPKIGDIVKASYMSDALRVQTDNPTDWPTFTGIVTNVEKQKSLFSDKYAIVEIETMDMTAAINAERIQSHTTEILAYINMRVLSAISGSLHAVYGSHFGS